MEKLDWEQVSKQSDLSDSFLQEYKEMLNWRLLSQYRTFTKESIETFKKHVHWEEICSYQSCLDVSFIYKNSKHICFAFLSTNEHITEEVVKEFKEKINWARMLTDCDVDICLVEEFKEYINWSEVSKHADRLRSHFISAFREELHWEEVSKNIPVMDSLSFVRKYLYKLHIPSLLTYNNLSSNILQFLFEHDCMDWDLVAIYQKPHAQFTEKYIEYLNIEKMYKHHEPMYSERKWKELKRLKKEKGSIITRKRKG